MLKKKKIKTLIFFNELHLEKKKNLSAVISEPATI